jgi:filamentous hemagglutinin
VHATTLNNTAGGSIVATNNNVIVATDLLDNQGGSLGAKGDLDLTATRLANDGGAITGDRSVTVTTSATRLGGMIKSLNDLTLNISGDFTNTGLLSAPRNLTINAANIDNSGTLHADNRLSLTTGNLINTGEISSFDTIINATGTLTNSGLIDGTTTRVTAGTLFNTGRLYGDLLSVGGGTLNNTGIGVIAARDTLNIGAVALNNTAGGLIYAINDINVGGALDAQGRATGTLQSVLNEASKIEAGRDLTVNASTLTNRNVGLVTQQMAEPARGLGDMLQPSGDPNRYPLSRVISYGDFRPRLIVDPQKYGQRATLPPAVQAPAPDCVGAGVDMTCTYFPAVPTYAWNDSVFAQFSVTAMTGPRPVDLVDADAWDTAFLALSSQLDARIADYNAGVNFDNRTIEFEDYTIYRLSSTTSTTQIVNAGVSAEMLSGRDMNFTGAVDNVDSRIVAGRSIFTFGPALRNIGTPSTTTTTYSGTTQFSHVDRCAAGTRECRREDGQVAYNPAPEPAVHGELAIFVYQTNAAGPTTTQAIDRASTIAQGAAAASAAAAAADAVSSKTATIGANVGATVAVASSLQTTVGADVSLLPSQQATALIGASLTGSAQSGVGSLAAAANVLVGLGTPTRIATNLAVPTIQRVTAAGSAERARDVILTLVPRLVPPTNNLFHLHPEPNAAYLVETDPRFTHRQTFLGSDYFLAQLSLDPERSLKRYGDGFYEQSLIDDQVLTLTGRRYLSGYTNTETEFKALMNAGVAYARQYQLTPGVALSAEQMALLTTDIVWLTTQTVTLADGSTQTVLVPELYIRRPAAEDLSTSGALIAANNVHLQTEGDLANSGRIQGNKVTLLSDQDIVNTGTVRGQDLYARAERDLKNLSGLIQGTNADSKINLNAGRDIVLQTQSQTTANADGSSTRSGADRIATVQGGSISFNAARDLIAQGARVNAATDLTAEAGRSIDISALQGSYQLGIADLNGGSKAKGRTGYLNEAATTQTLSSFTAGSNLSLTAQAGDLTLKGSTLDAGNTSLRAVP